MRGNLFYLFFLFLLLAVIAVVLFAVTSARALADAAKSREVEDFSADSAIVIPAIEESKQTAEPVKEDSDMTDVCAETTASFDYYEEIPLTYDEQAALTEACNRFRVDRALLLGLIEQETNFRNITGDGGKSIGYCQIQPRWWSGLMQEIGAKDLSEPRDNFMTACAIIKSLCEKYGDTELALTAYNTGHGGQSRYAESVLNYTEKWSEVLYG